MTDEYYIEQLKKIIEECTSKFINNSNPQYLEIWRKSLKNLRELEKKKVPITPEGKVE